VLKCAAVEHDVSSPAGKVTAGFFSFTEVTDPAAHRAYNEWHQLDHLPEQLPLPGVVFGQRWVSTPACRRARAVDRPPLDAVQYVTLYLMTEPLEQTLSDFAALAARLRAEDRFFGPRRSHLSGPFAVDSAAAARRVLVSAAAVPFRPGTGVYVVVRAATPGRVAAITDGSEDEALLRVAQVAGVWRFSSAPELAGERWHPGEHRVTVCFLDGDPTAAAAQLGPLWARSPGGERRVVLAGPFETIVPGEWDWFDGAGAGTV